jgi:hypothetical protein
VDALDVTSCGAVLGLDRGGERLDGGEVALLKLLGAAPLAQVAVADVSRIRPQLSGVEL